MSGAEIVTQIHRLIPVLSVRTRWLCRACGEVRSSPLNFTQPCWATKSDMDHADAFAYAMAAKAAQ